MLNFKTVYFPKIGKPAHEQVLTDSLVLEQWIVPKGARIKTYQTKNFGYVILQEGQQDMRGFIIPRRLFRY